ncbi:MAG: hypothetical protein JWN23_2540 [Rhodocyclales bacterium]|nr:hypothetical protein [Rhodocyclales bacterium]
MLRKIRKTIAHPALAIGSTLLWGVVEFVALQRSARMSRGNKHGAGNTALLGRHGR